MSEVDKNNLPWNVRKYMRWTIINLDEMSEKAGGWTIINFS